MLPVKLILFFYRLKFFFTNPKKSIIHILSQSEDYSRITISDLKRYMTDTKVIIEAGSADGVDTLLFAKNFDKATIFALEPVKKQYDFLLEKFKQFNNIKLTRVALSSRSEPVSIFIGKSNGELGGMGSSSLLKPTLHNYYFPQINFSETQITEAVTLDKFIKDNDIEIVDLLWLDIQGMELEVIQSSELIIRRKVKLIHLEISRIKFYDATPSEKNIRLFLKNIGFRCVIDKVGAISGNALYLNTNIKN
jgi:FkbM family methyltransferase